MHGNKKGGGGGGKKGQLLKQIAEKKEMSDSLIKGMSTALNLQYSPNVHFQKVNGRNKRRAGVFQVYTIPISQQFLLSGSKERVQ